MNHTFTSSYFDQFPVKPKIVTVEDPWIGGQAYCLHDFDTPEIVDCYSIGELEALRNLLDDAITKHKNQKTNKDQMYLWPELIDDILWKNLT